MIKKVLKYLAITLIWLCLWQVAAMIVSSPLLLPTPIAVAARILELCATSALYITLLSSFARIILGLIIGVALGVVGGTVTARHRLAKEFFAPVLAVIKSTPIASFIILILLWLDRDSVPVVISLLVVLPVVWSNVEAGILNTDKALLEMARAYKMRRGAMIKHIYLPILRRRSTPRSVLPGRRALPPRRLFCPRSRSVRAFTRQNITLKRSTSLHGLSW